MVAFLFVVGLDSAECMSTHMFYKLLAMGSKRGDTLNIEFAARPEHAIKTFLDNPKYEVLMYQSGELSLSPASMLDYMYKPYSPMTIVHPLANIAWDRVAAFISMNSPLPTHMLGLDYNVTLATAEATEDPDILHVRNCTLTNFKVDRATAEKLAKGELDKPIGAYIKETGALTDRRPHLGCIGDRCIVQPGVPQAA